MENPQSALLYKRAPGGVHDASLIAFRGFHPNTGDPVDLEEFCTCEYVRLQQSDHSRPCLQMHAKILTNLVGFGNLSKKNYSDHFYEVPMHWKLGEHLKLSCQHPTLDGFSIAASPFGAPFRRLEEAFAIGMDYVNQFYAKHFESRPLYLNPSGYYNNILLSKKIFLGVSETNINEINTYMTLVSFRTKTASTNYTEFTVAWLSDRYLVVKSVNTAKAFDVVSFIAGPLLLSERMYSLFFKIKKKGHEIDRKACQRQASFSTSSGPNITVTSG